MSEEAKRCPVCRCSKLTVFMHGVFDCDDTAVLECADCGLQLLDPMMSEAEEDAYYRDYYEHQKSRHFSPMSMGALQQRALAHYEQYEAVYGGLLQGRRRVLEIGYGSGGFLRFAKSRQPSVELTAIERSETNLEFLRDPQASNLSELTIHGDHDDLALQAQFDLVAAFGVFEHVRDGVGFLRSLRARLADGDSRLVLNIPNKDNPLVYFYDCEAFKKFTYMKQHYFTHTERSLRLLADQVGLEVERFNYLQVWGLDNHLSWLRHGKPRDFARFTELLSEETRSSYNEDLIARKMTDLMMVILRKKRHPISKSPKP